MDLVRVRADRPGTANVAHPNKAGIAPEGLWFERLAHPEHEAAHFSPQSVLPFSSQHSPPNMARSLTGPRLQHPAHFPGPMPVVGHGPCSATHWGHGVESRKGVVVPNPCMAPLGIDHHLRPVGAWIIERAGAHHLHAGHRRALAE